MVCTRRKATGVDYSWKRTVLSKDLGSCRTQSASSVSKQALLQQRCGQAKNHIKNFAVAELKGLKREMASESDWFNGSRRHS